MLGDSVTLGLGLTMDEGIARRVGVALERDDVEVLSFGVTGYGTRQEVELLRTRGLQYAPDVVVVLFVENDWSDASSHYSLVRLDRPRLVEELFRRSAAFRLASLRLDWFAFGQDADAQGDGLRFRAALEADRRRRGTEDLEPVRDALRLLVQMGCEHGFVAAVAIWPTFPPGGIMDRGIPSDDPDVLRIERIAWDEGLPTVRLSDAFLDDFPRYAADRPDEPHDPKQLYALDEMHPTPRGAAVAGRGIARWLVETPGLLGGMPTCDDGSSRVGQPLAGCVCRTR